MREVQSDQTQVSSGCIVHVSWTIPDGFLVHEIQHFTVYVNDTRVYNESLGNETVAMRAYNMCTCDIHKIKLSAIDACGNIGKNHSFSVKKPEPLPDLEQECENIGGKTPLPTPNYTGIDVPLIIIILINNNYYYSLHSDYLIAVIIGWIAFGVVLIPLIVMIIYCARKKIYQLFKIYRF